MPRLGAVWMRPAAWPRAHRRCPLQLLPQSPTLGTSPLLAPRWTREVPAAGQGRAGSWPRGGLQPTQFPWDTSS